MSRAGDSFRATASGAAGITRQSGRILDTGATIRHNRDVGPQKLRQGLVGGGKLHIDLQNLFLTSGSGNLGWDGREKLHADVFCSHSYLKLDTLHSCEKEKIKVPKN